MTPDLLKEKDVIFCSHQWVAFNHPDPGGEQLRALQQTRPWAVHAEEQKQDEERERDAERQRVEARQEEKRLAREQQQARKQAEWLDGDDGELAQYAIKGSDADWDAALGGKPLAGGAPRHVSLQRAAGASEQGGAADGPKKKKKRDKAGSDRGGGHKKRKK